MALAPWLRDLLTPFIGPPGEPWDPHWPAFYRAYVNAGGHDYPADRELHEIPVVVLDAETTGLDIHDDRILSLGGLRVLGNSIQLGEKFEEYLPTPEGRTVPDTIRIHGIIPNSHRYTFTNEAQLMEDLLAYVGNAIIVGHHIGFDVAMINAALARQGAGPLRNRVFDTVELAKRLRPAGYWTPKETYSLDALARRHRIPLSDRHTALGDCYITAVLWLKLLTRFGTKKGRYLRVGDL
ncbi:PolC-type DNA polymerase III [Lewinella sp. IMCC34183]|uniref:3'-5' exonuclease n=1 Tax=Lewinella sp. IMCC34183 TaxID=2248762 RepID=UPI000E24EEB0|nr:3'-5' exonuclease [Lewinella sp. IMCC34183]